MLGDYRWEKTAKLTADLGEIEILRKVYEAIPGMPRLSERLQRHSLLRSGVFSARIEGIPATVQIPRVEAQNLVEGYRRIFSGGDKGEFGASLIRQLHTQAMKNLTATAGEWRQEPWAIYNQAGIAIHIAPPHFKLPELMEEYITHINHLYDHPVEVAAAAQFILEKIHPFADGNGRVGRLVSAWLLEKAGYGFKGLLTLEEYIEKQRERYYAALEPSHQMTEFVEFFTGAVRYQAQAGLELIGREDAPGETLLPRRGELLEIIRDHPRCSFDFLQRRFAAINPKTLHYDLGWLLKRGYVKKLGVSRGVVYEER